MATFNSIETAESYANGNALSGLNGGSNWGGAWTIGADTGFTITNTQANRGTLSICRITGSTTSASYYRQMAQANASGQLYFSVRTSDVTASVGWMVTLGIGAGAPSADIAIRQGDATSQMQYLSGGGAGWTNIQAISNNTWYRVGLEWDTVGQVNKFRFQVDGGAWSSWVNGGTSIGSITAIQLTNAGNGTACNVFFDDIDFKYLPIEPSDSNVTTEGTLAITTNNTIPTVTDSNVTTEGTTRVKIGFQNASKNAATMTNQSKNAATMTNQSKNASTFTNQEKI